MEEKLKGLEAAYGTDTGDAELLAEWKQHRNRLNTQIDTLTRQRNEALKGFSDVEHLQKMKTTIETAIQKASGLEDKRERLIQHIGRLESSDYSLNKRL